jgi:hypothetical protein
MAKTQVAEKEVQTTKPDNSGKQFFVVLTEFKEIFAGYSDSDPSQDIIVLHQARQVIYYSAETKGLLGLAANGPAKNSRISNACPEITIRRPVNILIATDQAIEKFSTIIWK